MKILVAEKLSEHRYKTPEGYLICVDSILARTGKQTYNRSEIFGDSENDGLIEVDRKAEEVFSPETMASFENKPICVEHPDVDVNSGNISEFAVGFVRDIHKGEYEGEPVMLGTLVITDAKTVEEIEEGKHTDLSCGYDCDIDDSENPQQRNIRGNHVALCEHGRAGIARIVDSMHDANRLPAKVKQDLQKFLSHKSTFIRNKNYDISEFVREFERASRLWAEFPLKIVRESIRGWFKTGDGMMRKDYEFSIEGYNDRFMVSLYAKPNTYETTELNAYFTDSVNDEESTYTEVTKNLEKEVDKDMSWLDSAIKDAEQTFRVLAIVPGDYDDEPGFDIIFNVKANSENEAIEKAKKYAEKTPAYRFAWAFRLAEHNQHARIERNVDSVKDAEQLYAVEFSYDGDSRSDYLGHVNVRAKSEQEALSKAKRWAVNRYDNPGFFKIASTKYTNVETIDSIKDGKKLLSITKAVKSIKSNDAKEIKDYVPFPKKDALNKSNGLEEIKRIINNKDNTFEDTEGMIYLTEKAYNDIKVVIKMYGITQKELEGISKYFFGPGGYNMFK